MENKKKIYIALVLFLIAMVIMEAFFAHPHHTMPWNTIPGADIVVGFGSAWLLIFLAKILMTRLLQRDEDYYEKDCGRDDSSKDRCGRKGGGQDA